MSGAMNVKKVGMELSDGEQTRHPSPSRGHDSYVAFTRVEMEGINLSLGCATRSAITGDIDMKRMKKYPDYCIVDLFDRQSLPCSLNALKQDKFLFRPVPLTFRTWLYHTLFDRGFLVPGAHEENQLIRYILAQKCIDAPTSSGLGSPLQCYVPLSFGVCLMGNPFLVVITIFFLLFVRHLCLYCNNPQYYVYSRAVSLPFRIAFLVVILQAGEMASFGQAVGLLLVIFSWLFDVVIGDVTFLATFRLNCTYNILTVLGNRTYVCYRHGAMGQEEAFGERGRVDEDVSGMAVWERSHILVADIGDIIVELRPLTDEDWEVAMEKYYTKGPLPYICTRVFEEIATPCSSTWASINDRPTSDLRALADSQDSRDVVLEDM